MLYHIYHLVSCLFLPNFFAQTVRKAIISRHFPLTPFCLGQNGLTGARCPTSGPLQLTPPIIWKLLPPDDCTAHFLTSSRPLLKSHLLSEASSDLSIQFAPVPGRTPPDLDPSCPVAPGPGGTKCASCLSSIPLFYLVC